MGSHLVCVAGSHPVRAAGSYLVYVVAQVVAVRDADGELTAAHVGADGLVAAAVDESGWPKALDASTATVVPAQPMNTMATVPRAMAQATPPRPNAVVFVADTDGQGICGVTRWCVSPESVCSSVGINCVRHRVRFCLFLLYVNGSRSARH